MRDAGPALHADVTGIATDGWAQHVVHFSVGNDGGVTAEGVQVVGELRRGGEVVELASVTLPYVPVESSRSSALVFGSDPESGELDVRATAYNLP